MKCKFCSLIKGEGIIYKVYEDKIILAFMDKHPVNPGHILVVPKEHQSNFEDLDNELFQSLMLVVKKISKIIKKITNCKKVGILVAGFDVPHTHIHIIPMNKIKDVATRRIWEKKQIDFSEKELESFSKKVFKRMK